MSPPGPQSTEAFPWGRIFGGAFAGVLALFFVSGAAGLVYEVTWTRRLLLLLGSTSSASAVVLSAFLGGLGLGAAALGGRADRARRPLLLYGALEIAAALWALAVPFVLSGLAHPYVALASHATPPVRWALRAAIAVVVVVPGAAAVGATFPALMAAAARGGRATGPSSALLYGVNTLGAVLGALWAGFFGIFDLGVTGASRAAALASAAVGVLAVLLGRATPAPVVPAAPTAPSPSPRAGGLRGPLLLAALSGFVALGLEAAGVRILVFFIEGFTPSFAAMLGTFLAGLGLGSLALGPWLSRRARPGAAAGLLLLLAGAAVLLETKAVGHVEDALASVRRWAYAGSSPVAGQRVTALLGSALLFFVPSLLLGATFPLAVRWAAGDDPQWAGRAAGRVYLASSIGSVLGPVLVLLLGSRVAEGDAKGGPLFAWALFGAIAALAGAGLVVRGLPRLGRRVAAGTLLGAALGVLGALALADASPAALVRASHVLRVVPGSPDGSRTLLAARADGTTTASVVETARFERILYTDEFQAAATGRSYPYMRLLGHLPAIGAASPANALVIAFGTGTTAGALAVHDEVTRLEVAETSRAVLGLSGLFELANGKVLEQGAPRVRVLVGDGRDALLLHAADLDVVTLEPLLPYTPAALPFYTHEFYELARDRLRDGGVIAQWVPVHAMPVDLYAALVRTFFEVFPGGSLWFFEQSTVLLGQKGAAHADAETMARRVREAADSIGAAGLAGEKAITGGWVASGAHVLASLRERPPGPLAMRVVTDDDPFPEAYPSPRAGLVTSYLPDTLHWLASLVSPDDDPAAVPETALSPPTRLERLAAERALFARAEEAAADFFLATGDRARALERFTSSDEAFHESKKGREVRDLPLLAHAARAERMRLVLTAEDLVLAAERSAGDPSAVASAAERAREVAKRAYEVDSPDPIGSGLPAAALAYGEALLLAGRCAEAEDAVSAARLSCPWDLGLREFLGAVMARRNGRALDPSVPGEVRRALEASPPCSPADSRLVRRALQAVIEALNMKRSSQVREAGEMLLSRLSEATTPAEDVAAALRAIPEGGDASLRAERAALLRAVSPADGTLVAMLGDPDEARWRAALLAAAHYKFRRLALEGKIEGMFVASKDVAHRIAFCSAALDDGGPWALERLADLLLDADETVRGEAYLKLSVRIPAARRGDLAFDPTGSEEQRARAQKSIRAWLESRK